MAGQGGLRLGRRVLASEERGEAGEAEYQRQRRLGVGTNATQFRLGPRILNRGVEKPEAQADRLATKEESAAAAATTAAAKERANPKATAPKPKAAKTGGPKPTAPKRRPAGPVAASPVGGA